MSRRVLITGTTRGLGRDLADYYLDAGDVVFGCGRSASTIDHPRYAHHCVDVGDEASVAAMFSTIRASHDGLDVLINNAGTASMNAFALMPPSATRTLVNTNVLGPMLLAHGAVRLLRRSTAGRIVNITTIAVPLRLAGEAVYVASKAAIELFTRVLAKEVGVMGITVNAVGPSLIPTRLTSGLTEDMRDRLLRQQAIPRHATVSDVANAIDFFLKPESELVTGQVMYLGGIG